MAMFSMPRALAEDVLLLLNNTVDTVAMLPAPSALAEAEFLSPITVATEAILPPPAPDTALT